MAKIYLLAVDWGGGGGVQGAMNASCPKFVGQEGAKTQNLQHLRSVTTVWRGVFSNAKLSRRH